MSVAVLLAISGTDLCISRSRIGPTRSVLCKLGSTSGTILAFAASICLPMEEHRRVLKSFYTYASSEAYMFILTISV